MYKLTVVKTHCIPLVIGITKL